MDKPHSGLGISACVIAVAAALLLLASIGVAAVLQVSTPGGMSPQAVSTVVTGLVMLFGLMLCLLSGGLGLASLFQRERRALFGVIGLAISAAMVLLVFVLWVIGNLAG